MLYNITIEGGNVTLRAGTKLKNIAFINCTIKCEEVSGISNIIADSDCLFRSCYISSVPIQSELKARDPLDNTQLTEA